MVSDHDDGTDDGIGFFKILNPDHLGGSKFIIIPRGFERRYNAILPSPLVLRLPNNAAEWKVSWIKSDYQIWFQQDWIRFAQDCSLRVNQFIYFKYEGESHFKVRIFDECFCEIDYSGIRCNIEEGTTNHLGELLKTKEVVDVTQPNVSAGAKSGDSMVEVAIKKQKPSAFEKAMNHKTKNPGFMVKLTPSYVNKDVLNIPGYFWKKYLHEFSGTASIGVSEDSTKHVEIKINKFSQQRFITCGWNSFCNEYNLQVGDKCYFDMTKSTPVSFKISFHRSKKGPNNRLQGKQVNQNSQQREPMRNKKEGRCRTRKFGKRKRQGISTQSKPKTGYESNSARDNKYRIHIKKYHLRYGPSLKAEFFTKYPIRDGKRVKLQVGEKRWEVKVKCYDRFGRLSAGWTTFVRECTLETENIWELDMIDEENLVFKVSIES